MSDLRPGMQIFHNGKPVELLYRTDEYRQSELWHVRPLFVYDEPDRDEVFEPNDRISFLHTNRVRGAGA